MFRSLPFVIAAACSVSVLAAEPSRLGAGPGSDSSRTPASQARNYPPSLGAAGPGATATSPAAQPGQRDGVGGAGAGPGAGPDVSSPYWNGGAASEPFPAADIRRVPSAKAAAVYAKMTHEQLITDLDYATRMMRKSLENTDEYKKAAADAQAAYDAMQSARRDALAGLNDDANYSATNSLRRDLTRQIQDTFARPNPDYDLVYAMAMLKIDYVANNRVLETKALNDSPAYQQARSSYIAAAKRVSEADEVNAMSVSLDENLVSLRRQLVEARIARAATDAYLHSSVRARDLALRYAAYYRSIDRYRPNAGGYGGYYGGGFYNVGGNVNPYAPGGFYPFDNAGQLGGY